MMTRIQTIVTLLDDACGQLWELHEESDAVQALIVGSIHDGAMQLLSDAANLQAAMEGRVECNS